ncbi:MAG TPA: hypothetical protein VFR35_16460 [Actinoplanes sp.]|nr:hypothetical protein [Actinoplanes sp.]
MTRLRGPFAATAAAALFLLGGCARPAGDQAGASRTESATAAPAGADLVLRVRQEGGFVPPEQIVGRIPTVSVYADGRIITEGPVALIYPGPALPNLQVRTIEPDEVTALAEKALGAGVRTGADLGHPNVTDVPVTRIDVVVAGATHTVSAEALGVSTPDDPMLTAEQKEARARLAAFVQELTSPPDVSEQRAYRAESVAALAQPYHKPDDGLPGPAEPTAWPGPALPGEYLSPNIKIGCVEVTGAGLDRVLTAAAKANQNTPWSSGGNTYGITFRPLLPDEAGCAGLKTAR